ncbi:diphthine synthase [Aciduliprofundum sp. MAR08-339]|uniref:diphthine synthase n=1 Tax=Aciduliprofundum sp. (strain MAR08-339) TaxID=673860 RepID=UPI0002A4A06C|nr:diphthine synthase [Aciduliprofundum sp. MAR08-339]
MLTFVGLGLGGLEDITLRGKGAIENADVVFAEFYTSKLINADIEDLERFYGKRIILLGRDDVEDGKIIMNEAQNKNVVLLVAGDPMIATTHVALRIMAQEFGIETRVIHNASIISVAPGLLGLQNYKFGRTVSIPFPQENFFPTSAYDHIMENLRMGLHTLILLDINPRPMSANEAMQILLEMEKVRGKGIISEDTIIAVVARAGSEDALVRAGKIKHLIKEDFGPPLHTLVLPGKLHFAEAEALVKLAGAPEEILD